MRLDRLLNEKGWTFYRLMKESGLSLTILGKYRDNKVRQISIETLDRLCEVLQCKAGDLIEYVPEKKGKRV